MGGAPGGIVQFLQPPNVSALVSLAVGLQGSPVRTYAARMELQVPKVVEEELEALARRRGRPVGLLVEAALHQYLLASNLTDLRAADIAATQEALLGELVDLPGWTSTPRR